MKKLLLCLLMATLVGAFGVTHPQQQEQEFVRRESARFVKPESRRTAYPAYQGWLQGQRENDESFREYLTNYFRIQEHQRPGREQLLRGMQQNPVKIRIDADENVGRFIFAAKAFTTGKILATGSSEANQTQFMPVDTVGDLTPTQFKLVIYPLVLRYEEDLRKGLQAIGVQEVSREALQENPNIQALFSRREFQYGMALANKKIWGLGKVLAISRNGNDVYYRLVKNRNGEVEAKGEFDE